MKKWLRILVVLTLIFSFLVGCSTAQKDGGTQVVPEQTEAARTTFHIASLKGPTTMGMVKLMTDNEAGGTKHEYQFTMYGTADEVVPLLVKGEIDIALLPANLASVLYNKTEGGVQVAAVNTLGVLYIVENGDSIQQIEDLRGKTIYNTGKGTTPEYALNYILMQNGLEPGKDVFVEFKSEATELAVMLEEDKNAIAVLPQPYVTGLQMQNPKVRVALNMSEEWDKVSQDSSMITGVVLVNKAFAGENKAAFQEFLKDYQASTIYVNENIEEAAVWVEQYGIVAKAPIAVKAIPACNITYIDNEEMKTKVGGYLQVLFEANPESVGGALPQDDFYFKNK
jgi:NitT/TauT family transport system substrate-binding protein